MIFSKKNMGKDNILVNFEVLILLYGNQKEMEEFRKNEGQTAPQKAEGIYMIERCR